MMQLTPFVLQEFYDGLWNKYQPNTINSIMGTVNNSLNYAVHPLGLLKENPVNYIIRKKKGTKVRQQASNGKVLLTEEDIKNLFLVRPFGNPFYIPYLFGIYCGLRISEAAAVTWDNIDLENGTLTVNKQLRYRKETSRAFTDSYDETKTSPGEKHSSEYYLTTPKYNSERVINLGDQLTQILRQEKQRQDVGINVQKCDRYFYYSQKLVDQNNEEYGKIITVKSKQQPLESPGDELHFVCVKQNGELISPWAIGYDVRKLKSIIGKDFIFHSLRHTHATMLIKKGTPPHAVQERLGHKNVAVTMRIYTHNSQAMEDELVKNLAKITENTLENRGQTVDKDIN